jgi:citrate synthase
MLGLNMAENHDHKDVGLRGIDVADTNLCLIEGREERLFYRGYNIFDLAKNSSFEEVAYLLIHGDLPTEKRYSDFSNLLISNRSIPQELVDHLNRLPRSTPSMKVLQSSIALLASYNSELEDDSQESNKRKAFRIISKMPTIVATWERIRNNQTLLTPNDRLSHAANFLYMLHGTEADMEIVKCFDVALILHAEHSFNASTFTARVIASTGADLYSAISGAIGSLSGRLHGGANSRVAQMLNNIGDSSNVENWVKSQFDEGRRIMGMGHAVYKTMDPRARILKGIAGQMIQRSEKMGPKWLNMTNKLVEVTQSEFMKKKGRQIYPNVDLYSASVYSTMNIPIEAFTPIFALARAAGWTAHALEEKFPDSHHKPVLYRPSADYMGNYCGPEGCKFIPLEDREK